MLRALSFPDDEVLESSTPTTTVHQLINLEGFSSIDIDDAGGWGGYWGRTQYIRKSRLQSWHMKGWMYSPHGWWKPQADGCGTDDVGNGKGTHVSRCKLLGTSSYRDVLSGEPHALSKPVGGSRSSPLVGLFFHPCCCFRPMRLRPPALGWETMGVGNRDSTLRVRVWMQMPCDYLSHIQPMVVASSRMQGCWHRGISAPFPLIYWLTRSGHCFVDGTLMIN